MIRPTFLGLHIGSSGLTSSQKAIDVTGNNIANVNTVGYTRQRADLYSISTNSPNVPTYNGKTFFGQGQGVSGFSQARDTSLDVRFRTESSKLASQEVQESAFRDLENIFNEVEKDGLNASITDLLEQFQTLSTSPSDSVIEGIVKTYADMTAGTFRSYAEQIEAIEKQQLEYLENGVINRVNEITNAVSELNEEIMRHEGRGNKPLELYDSRNNLIDELSKYIDIEVKEEPYELGPMQTVTKYSVKLKGTDPSLDLINHNDIMRIELAGDIETGGISINAVSYDKDSGDIIDTTDITIGIKSGQIHGYLQFLNGSGDFGTTSFENKGVIHYKEMLNTLASTFANELNNINTDSDGNNHPLFDSTDGLPIKAYNIKISDDWYNTSDSYIINTTKETVGDNSGANDNLMRFVAKFEEGIEFKTEDGKDLFKGTLQQFTNFTSVQVGTQVLRARSAREAYAETTGQIEYARSSISSVDLNEEGVNILTYSKSYNAAARVMTVMDEMLDNLINRMGV